MATDQDIRDALYDVIDPELNMNIVDLGLVYRTHAVEGNIAEVDFTLTYPGCPLGDVIAGDIVSQVKKQTDVADVRVNVVWSPPLGPNHDERERPVADGVSHLNAVQDESADSAAAPRRAGPLKRRRRVLEEQRIRRNNE